MEYLDEQALNVYIDGSSLASPRRGGVGILFVTEGADGHWQADSYELPGFASGTNNQMEIQASIEAMTALIRGRAPVAAEKYEKVVFWTDSQYLVEGFNSARFIWPRTQWHTRDGNPVVNTRQWKELVRLASRVGRPVFFNWVKGHKGSAFNKMADKLARSSARGVLRDPLTERKVRRKNTSASVKRGSVEMLGQQLTIRIIEELPQPEQRSARFKYEVLSRASPFHGRVDYIWAERDSPLRAGHAYRVRVNTETRTPRIVKLFSEVDPR